jgi:hypothetical protein
MNARIPLIVMLGLGAALAQAQNSMQDESQQSAMPESLLAPDPLRPDASTSPPADAHTPDMRAHHATMDAEPAIPPAAPMHGMTAKTENGVTYLCGGVGKEEASYMKQHGRDHDLLLTFATRKGEYLADVNVAIEDARGQPVLNTTCDGPLMAVDLPKSGTYRIHAEAGGQMLDRSAHVNVKRRMASAAVMMTWPQSVGSAAPTATGSSGAEGRSKAGQPVVPTPR